MTADERPERETAEQLWASVQDALLAADLKRLVRASQDDDEETVSKIKANYIRD